MGMIMEPTLATLSFLTAFWFLLLGIGWATVVFAICGLVMFVLALRTPGTPGHSS